MPRRSRMYLPGMPYHIVQRGNNLEAGAEDPYGPSGAPTLAEQKAFIKQLLTDAGWSYKLVDDEDLFETEFYSGGYQAYVLFGEADKLDEDVQTALREAVFRGEGLVVAGNHDDRNSHTKKLNQALGLKLAGKIEDATGVDIYAGPLAENGSALNLLPGEEVLRIKLNGAIEQGRYTPATAGLSDDCNTTEGDFSDCQQLLTAVTSYDYGRGRSVYAGFDLLANAAMVGSNSASAQLILDALEHVHPALIEESVGSVVPVQLIVNNLGVNTDVRATLTLPDSFKVIDSADATVSTNPAGESVLSWNVLLDANVQATMTVWLRLPTVAGAVNLEATVEGALPGSNDYQLQAQPVLALNVSAAPTTAEIDTQLANLITNGIGETNLIDQARKSLAKADGLLPGDPEKAFNEALKAADSLAEAGTHPDINTAHVLLGQWLRELAKTLPIDD